MTIYDLQQSSLDVSDHFSALQNCWRKFARGPKDQCSAVGIFTETVRLRRTVYLVWQERSTMSISVDADTVGWLLQRSWSLCVCKLAHLCRACMQFGVSNLFILVATDLVWGVSAAGLKNCLIRHIRMRHHIFGQVSLDLYLIYPYTWFLLHNRSLNGIWVELRFLSKFSSSQLVFSCLQFPISLVRSCYEFFPCTIRLLFQLHRSVTLTFLLLA